MRGRYLYRMGTRIFLGSDHAGFEMKDRIKHHLEGRGFQVQDLGTNGPDSVDYPDFAHAVADSVANEEGALGILMCGSGNGVNITANKHAGIRAALAWQPEIAALAREHNNANLLSLPARYVTPDAAFAIVDAFLDGAFEGGRHQRRVEKIESLLKS